MTGETSTAPPLTLSATWEHSPYRAWNVSWRRHGPDQYVMLHAGVEIGRIFREYRGGWYLAPAGFAEGIPGLKTRRACAELLLTHLAVSPWSRDPTYQSHQEWSPDGITWTVDDRTEPGPWPVQARFYRWVAIGMAHKVRVRAETTTKELTP